MYHVNINQKKASVAMLISDFRTRKISRINNHYLMIKGFIFQKDITILNVCAPNQRSVKIMRQN